jgi:hypothetical protein
MPDFSVDQLSVTTVATWKQELNYMPYIPDEAVTFVSSIAKDTSGLVPNVTGSLRDTSCRASTTTYCLTGP